MTDSFETLLAIDLYEAENPEVLTESGLEEALNDVFKDSDDNLKAASWLLNFNLERLEERAARLEIDSGLNHVAANRQALAEIIRAYVPFASNAVCRWFSRNSSVAKGIADEYGLNQRQTADEIIRYVRRHNGAHSDVASEMDELLERIAE